MTTSRVQTKRTSVNNSPPTDLLPGELGVEMGVPTRLWVGVPASADPTKKKLLIDTSAAGHAPLVHTHPISDVVDLQAELDDLQNQIDNSAISVHTHEIADIDTLQAELNDKAGVVHRHTIADIDNLRTELDTMQAGISGNHVHQISQILGLQNDLDGKSDINHRHDFSQLTGALPAHTHSYSDITGTPPAPPVHTHPSTDITGLGALARLNVVTTNEIADGSINHLKLTPQCVGTGSIADNAVTGAKIALGGDTTGDLMVYNGTDWARLPAGGAGQVLQSAGPGVMPVWAASGGAGSVQIAGTAPLAHAPTTDVAIAGGPYSALRVGYKATNNSSGATMNINVQVFDGTTWGAAIPLASVLNSKTAEFWVYNTGTTNTPVLYALDIMDDRPDSIPTGVTTLLRFVYGTTVGFKLQVKVVGYR